MTRGNGLMSKKYEETLDRVMLIIANDGSDRDAIIEIERIVDEVLWERNLREDEAKNTAE